MLRRTNYQRFFPLLALALIPKSSSTRLSFAFASAFSPASPTSTSSCPSASFMSSTTARSMQSQDVSDNNVVSLSFLETSAKGLEAPPTLLVHGLDSSSQTWKGILDDLDSHGLGAVAVDNRGNGKSSLGDPNLFSPEALVDDLYALVSSHPMFATKDGLVKPFVFVGHSMGGRIAMSFAAKHPELIAALVIEDIDVKVWPYSNSHAQSKDRDATIAFDRTLPGISSPEQVVEVFAKEGYGSSQVEKWLSEGRVESDGDGGYYSQVNPAFRLLCYEQFFETNHGEDTWGKLATLDNTKTSFPIHLMIADPTLTVCHETSIAVMENAMKSSTSPVLKIHRYPGATHSIHNSAAEDFSKDLRAIIEEARNSV